jgi:hypothetical protein
MELQEGLHSRTGVGRLSLMLISLTSSVGGKKQHGGVESGSTVPDCDCVHTAGLGQPCTNLSVSTQNRALSI